jgi:ABC-type glycerol-3-phosphate transport system permease component
VLRWGAVAVALIIFAFPVIWMILTSLKTAPEVNSVPPTVIPFHLDFGNFSIAAVQANFFTYLRNTVFVSVGATLVCVVLATLAGYGLARYPIRGSRFILMALVATQMFPGILFLLPFYVLLQKVHLINTLPGLAIIYVALSLPFSVWMLRNFFRTVPVDIEEAAIVDGASRLGIISRIILPLAWPGVIAVALFDLILSWDDYVYASVILSSDSRLTLSLGLQTLVSEQTINWGVLMAGSVITAAPIIVAFVFFQRHFVHVISGAVKG